MALAALAHVAATDTSTSFQRCSSYRKGGMRQAASGKCRCSLRCFTDALEQCGAAEDSEEEGMNFHHHWTVGPANATAGTCHTDDP